MKLSTAGEPGKTWENGGGGGWLARVTLVETNIAMEIPSLDRFPFGKSETCTMIPQSSPENGKHAP